MDRQDLASTAEGRTIQKVVYFPLLASMLRERASLTRVAAIAPLALSFMAGCTTSANALDTPGTGGTGATGPVLQDGPDSIAFVDPETLIVATSEGRTLEIQASPPGSYEIRFALLGESLDASLDRSEVITDAEGFAEVVLTAPTRSAAFEVRASGEGTASARLPVSVSDFGVATVEVIPRYGGPRTINLWTASVAAGTTCDDLPGIPPPDGPLKNVAFPEQIPRIEDVPVGPALAVTIRADQFAGGCVELESVVPRQINQVIVDVADRPLQLTETDLIVRLGIDATDADWDASLLGFIDALTRAMLGNADTDAQALLEAMAASVPAGTESAFDAQSSVASWDDAVAAQLGNDEAAIRAAVSLWMQTGAAALEGPEVFKGRLRSSGDEAERALFRLTEVAGLSAEASGFARDNNSLTWTADPGDSVQLGGALFFQPSELLTGLSIFGASQAAVALPGSPALESVPEIIAETIGCESLAETFVDTGVGGGFAFGSCNTDCVRDLCSEAVSLMWQRAVDASGVAQQIGTLNITATAQAVVDTEARPLEFNGSWIGLLDVGLSELTLGGPARGSTDSPK